MFEYLPVGVLILIILAIMAACALLVNRVVKRVRRFILGSAQSLTDALAAYGKADNEFKAWSKESLETLEMQCRSLLDRGEELYKHNRQKVREVWRRVGMVMLDLGYRSKE